MCRTGRLNTMLQTSSSWGRSPAVRHSVIHGYAFLTCFFRLLPRRVLTSHFFDSNQSNLVWVGGKFSSAGANQSSCGCVGLTNRRPTQMRSYFAPAIAVAIIMPAILAARSDDIPTLDVRPVCRGIASQSELEAGLQRTNFELCLQSEQAVREHKSEHC